MRTLSLILIALFSFSVPVLADESKPEQCQQCVNKCLGSSGEAPPPSAVKDCEKQCECKLNKDKIDVS